MTSENLRTGELTASTLVTQQIVFGGGDINITCNTKDAPIMLDDIDVRELQARLANTEMVCKELYSVVAKQSEFINALWYAPGMPGTWEVAAEFKEVAEKEKGETKVSPTIINHEENE